MDSKGRFGFDTIFVLALDTRLPGQLSYGIVRDFAVDGYVVDHELGRLLAAIVDRTGQLHR